MISLTKLMLTILSLAGKIAPPWPAQRCGDAHGKRRVTLISPPDTKRGPVVYDDPGDANGAVAGA
jgi:hypothetical protein